MSWFRRFAQSQAAGGILLMACAVVALAWANSPWGAAYVALWQTTITVGVGGFTISKALLLWINDGLMAVFFFVVGLEIKRELLVGELSSLKKAALPMTAAVGGMAVPAAFYYLATRGTAGVSGWGIPMATDIAFALGVLALLGSRVPVALKIFLTALAIVDDLGAVLVIALFYTAELSVGSLGVGAGFLAALAAANRMGVRRTAVYVVLGLGLWLAFLKSGVHATIAGVLLALTVPIQPARAPGALLADGESLLARLGEALRTGKPDSDEVLNTVHELETTVEQAASPLTRMEHALHGWVAFLIMPVFALANAGVSLGADAGGWLGSPVTLGVIAGLVFGKQVGVTLFSWLSLRLGWAEMPLGVTMRQLYGVSCLCGIGFTMSLFVASLAFEDAGLLESAKVGILAASCISGIWGWLLLSRGSGEVERVPPGHASTRFKNAGRPVRPAPNGSPIETPT